MTEPIFSTLPVFRIAGVQTQTNAESLSEQIKTLWQQWHEIQNQHHFGFSKTNYCVYQYHENHEITITIGRLVSLDFELAQGIQDVWIPPQNYQVFEFNSKNPDEIQTKWQEIRATPPQDYRQHTDFESYPSVGGAKIYIGLTGAVEISEDDF